MDENNPGAGMVQVYTGDGKGKTTAALGLALRALGHGMRVHIVQFMKNPDMMDDIYGEIKVSRDLLPGLAIHSFGLPKWVMKDDITPEDKEEAQKALGFARDLTKDKTIDLIILDEVLVAVDFGLIELEELLDFIDKRPPNKELVLTGRNAPPEIIDKADLVTEMRPIKHYHEKGAPARKGIEY